MKTAFITLLSILLVLTSNQALASEGESGKLTPLSKHDRRILDRGIIPQGRYIAGGIVGSTVGFGIGHAIEGRYRDQGWIFTAGEGASVTAIFVAILACFGDPPPGQTCTPPVALAWGGLIGLVGFHIWETIDVWVGPTADTRRYHELRKLGYRSSDALSDLRIFPTIVSNEASHRLSPGLGLTLSF